MPQIAEVTSDEEIHTGSTKKTYASKKRRASSASDGGDVEEVANEANEANEGPEQSPAEGDEDEGGEEEYEIEKILDAKKGQFGGGRMGYFVKWKNYEEEHNSWVDERDAGNAQELIDLFWAEKKKNKHAGPRKSEPIRTKPKSIDRPSRKSLAEDSSIEPDSFAKKRGRPRKNEQTSGKQEAQDEDMEEQRVKKRPRKSNGQAQREPDGEEVIGNMKKYMKVASWEDLIDTIDTVEREDDGELFVFFTLKDKQRIRENSRLCADKFPQKLIMFYESNLRWKREDEPAVVE